MHLTFLRILTGILMMALHGWPKLQGYSVMSSGFPDPLGIGSQLSLILVIFAEFFCSIMLISGTFIRIASIPLIITMFVAAFIFHVDDPISKIELPLMYLGIYITLFIGGAGKYAFKLPIRSTNRPFTHWLFD